MTPRLVSPWFYTYLFTLPPSLPSSLPPSFQSPAHTARLKLLHELFPEAKFIHISRNPFEVYQSTSKLFMDLLIQVRPPSLPPSLPPLSGTSSTWINSDY